MKNQTVRNIMLYLLPWLTAAFIGILCSFGGISCSLSAETYTAYGREAFALIMIFAAVFIVPVELIMAVIWASSAISDRIRAGRPESINA